MNKSERLNQELIFLKDKTSFQLSDLMNEFGISKRTAIRDVQALENLGLALYVEAGRGGKYQLIQQNLLTPIYFNETEIQAIFFAIKALDLVSSTPFEKSYSQIRNKLLETLPSGQKINIQKILDVVSYHHVSPVNKVDNLADLLEAILNNRVISLHYTQYEPKDMTLQLFDLFYRSGLWFCNAFDMDEKKWGVFRCDYMLNISLADTSYIPYSKEEMTEFLTIYETKFPDIEFKCQLTSYGKELFLKRHYPNMELHYKDDAFYLVGKYNNEHLDYLVQYLISLGKHVTILSPNNLKEVYLNELHQIINSYE
ncbi:helix-turn-helix transcriptional regulator [Vagococcus hydrophili]|uniref:WYL domain-containing protein n=1 Tax=Vagococcus hydrophili TaxID=2714947 RepID=A0A6G8ARW9_9ENTE|nr:WYL domain-containing protein [Vagococcus hydrophili]QIL47828.1 WYL domain-containing protein [Vagococcus hydrophili]